MRLREPVRMSHQDPSIQDPSKPPSQLLLLRHSPTPSSTPALSVSTPTPLLSALSVTTQCQPQQAHACLKSSYTENKIIEAQRIVCFVVHV